MRKLLLRAFMPIACMLAIKTSAHTGYTTDSAKVTHVTDGKLDEWKIEKFETDPATKMQYAADHDGENLYVALKITDQLVQNRIMAFGMNMFIDKKGKKKESSGIEFPMKNAMGAFYRGGGDVNPKEAREKKASTMIFLKVYGLDNLDEEKMYFISEPGLVNLDFSWDEADNMYIEYVVPFSYLGSTALLNGKPLSIGWKIREGAMSTPGAEASPGSTTPTATSTRLVAVPAGSSPGGGTSFGRTGGGGSGRNSSRPGAGLGTMESRGNNFKETYVWTKYVLTF
jgi:hypothetical protein